MLYIARLHGRNELPRFPQPGDGGYCHKMVMPHKEKQAMGTAGTYSTPCTMHGEIKGAHWEGFPRQLMPGTATYWWWHLSKERRWVLQDVQHTLYNARPHKGNELLRFPSQGTAGTATKWW